MIKKNLCIYHANCADGFTSAWVVRLALGEENVIFHPGIYQDPPPDVTGLRVILVDFSYKRPVMEQIIGQAASVKILDHHQSAQEDLADLMIADLPDVEIIFDMNRSGARIAWDYYFPNEPPPPLLLHVEDRDLWRFALPGTRQIQAALFSYPYNFEVWDDLMAKNDLIDLFIDGQAIERKHFKDINELLKVVTRPMRIGGFLVDVANLPYTMTSDAGHQLAQDKPFGGCYWDTPNGRVFSLRSTDEGEDVAKIAQQYGGGGHRNASGFRVSFDQARKFEL